MLKVLNFKIGTHAMEHFVAKHLYQIKTDGAHLLSTTYSLAQNFQPKADKRYYKRYYVASPSIVYRLGYDGGEDVKAFLFYIFDCIAT